MSRSESISVRLDKRSAMALRSIAAGKLSRSEAIRMALIEAADSRKSKASLADEAKALAADKKDLEEVQEVSKLMEELRAPW